MRKSRGFNLGAATLAILLATGVVVQSEAATVPPGPAQPTVGVPAGQMPKESQETTLQYSVTGPVTVYRSSKESERFVIFVSGDGGWNQGVVDMARQLVRMNTTVVGVDIRRYLRNAQAGSSATFYPAGDLSALAQSVQKDLGFQRYLRPVLVGYSSGATLVYGALAQAPADTFQGALGLGFCPDLKTEKPLAAGDGRLTHTLDSKLRFIYEPSRTLTAPFVALQGAEDKVCPAAATRTFIAQTPRSSVIDLPKVGHGYSVPANWAPQFARAFASMYPVAPAQARASGSPIEPHLAALPITALPAAAGGDTLAVFYSGDGGWAGIDQGISQSLVQAGIPVIGYDSLRYFWTARTPQSAATDLAAVLRHYMTTWAKSRILLTGYSFGADALPIIVQHLPADLRSKVRLVALVGLDKDGELEVRPGDWLNLTGASAYQVAPALAALKGTPLLCIYGEREGDAACPRFSPGLIRGVKLAGGHHYDGEFASVSRAILEALPK